MALMTNDGTERLGFLLHDAARLMRKRFEMRGSVYGLSAAQWRLLVRVVKDEGVAQARLAELLEIEPISVSRLIDRMEEGGWIERRQDQHDRRVRTIHPTARSREKYMTATPTRPAKPATQFGNRKACDSAHSQKEEYIGWRT